ncbi:mitochondrial 50S ribosomal L22 [Pyrrhoderma noxium]|uniref:Mitochondrial 50S ribosomal L22 n=1 Tax=Pyrrhoderma noxium TaxID=2282107 RepID=A0A286UNX4_9AGAM|nr:mitochondrial 50S ribosomal L22 [Pyrrhoderma noxium]
MQSVANRLRAGPLRQARSSLLHLHTNQFASGSQAPLQWHQRRGAAFSPMEWFKKTLTPQIREQNSEKEIQQAREEAKESGQASVFEYQEFSQTDGNEKLVSGEKATEHRGATRNFKISHRKLNKLANQISGKPIDSAILQMSFSEKRASERIKGMLAQTKSVAIARGLDPERLVVSEAYVNKGQGGRMMKRIEFKGRGKMGIRTKSSSRMVVILREGQTLEEKKAKEREMRLKRIVSSGLVREDVPLRNPSSQWTW